jgi:hypothetical protein
MMLGNSIIALQNLSENILTMANNYSRSELMNRRISTTELYDIPERKIYSRKLTVHNKSSSNAILVSFLEQKYGNQLKIYSHRDESNMNKFKPILRFESITEKPEIKARSGQLSLFPNDINKDNDEMVLPKYFNMKKPKTSPKYLIELAVFVDNKLYEILRRTFPRNTQDSISNLVLAKIDMVSTL